MTEPTISISPEPDTWRSAMVTPPTEHARDRGELGLPTDRPVVFTGHQPIVWHAGILAKLLAASELATQTGAALCWIIADLDEIDPTRVRIPDGKGTGATARVVQLLAGDPPPPGVPTGSLEPRAAGEDHPALEGLAPLLDAYAYEPTLAWQVTRAVLYRACERFGIDEPGVIACSDLVRTDAWRALVDAMTHDPRGCTAAYNEAASLHPHARVRPLVLDENRCELPLWRARAGMPRLAVFADQLGSIPPDELRPRALAMTAIVRAALCELFIHGTGGGLYDQITDSWLETWQHAPAWSLAPTAVATADAYADLGLALDELPDPAHAHWRAHHARHHPAMIGDQDAEAHRRRLVEQIRHAKQQGDDPGESFRALHAMLDNFRAGHAAELETLARRARDADRLAGLRRLARDRTWPWPTLADATLDALHARIRGRFAPVPSASCSE